MGDDPDADIPIFTADYERELSAEEVKALGPDEQYEYLLSWFFHYFEDPAHETPYESAEGGYQYIFGGPYDAEEELGSEFGDAVPEEVMQRVIDRLQTVGFEWAPSDNHPNRSRDEEDDRPTEPLDQVFERLQSGLELTPDLVGSPKRQAVIDAANALQDALVKFAAPSIGHNHPPEDIEADEAINQEQISELTRDLTFVKEEAAAPRPDFLSFASILKNIKELGKLLFKGAVAQAGKDMFEAGAKELHHLSPLLDGLVNAGIIWLHSLLPF